MIQKVLNILKVVGFFLLVADLEAQDTLFIKKMGHQQHRLNKQGMVVLTSWASVNILSGSAVFISNSYEEKCFYAMNSGWGLVNLAIAIPSLLAKPKSYSDINKLSENLRKTEKVFLLNAGLDVLYVTAGIAAIEYSKTQESLKQEEMFSGFGKSVVIQGASLLVFDGIMFQLNKNLRKKSQLSNPPAQVFVTPNGLHFIYRF